jgi:four helix bundle protein
MSFRAQDSSFELARSLRDLLRRLARVDQELARQIRRAATSVALNLAEGNGRAGKDRLHCFRIARGSALEVEAGLELAVAWGHVDRAGVTRSLDLVHDVLAMLAGLLR